MRSRTGFFAMLASAAMLWWGAGTSRAADWDDERSARAFEMLDVDNSGTLTSAEFQVGIQGGKQSESDKTFQRLDTNRSGTISPRELEEGWDIANNVMRPDTYKVDPIAQARVQESAFVRLDANHDDFLSAEEFQSGIRVKSGKGTWEFERIDDNRDGRLSRSEFNEDWGRFRKQLREDVLYGVGNVSDEPTALRNGEKKELAFVFLDSDDDGRISIVEYRSGLRPRYSSDARSSFNAIDDNGDGLLTRAEFYEDWNGVEPKLRQEIYAEPQVLGVERAAPSAATPLEDIFDEMDADDDGRLTMSEFTSGVPVSRPMAAKRFRTMDRNDDWFLTRSEFDAHWVKTRLAQ